MWWHGYPTVKIFWRYVYSFWQNSRRWRTDGQTPHDGIGRVCIALRGKNREMSVRPSVRAVSSFSKPCNAPRPLGRRPWHLAVGTYILSSVVGKLIESGILNFGRCVARGHPELSPVGRDEMTNLEGGVYYLFANRRSKRRHVRHSQLL